MGTLGFALVVGGSALLISVLIFLIPFRGKRGKPVERFEDSQRRMRATRSKCARTVTTYDARLFLYLAHLTASSSCSRSSLFCNVIGV